MSLMCGTVLDRIEPGFIGRPDDRAALDAAAGHPHREARGIVIAASAPSLADRCPAELTAPDDQRLFQEAAFA